MEKIIYTIIQDSKTSNEVKTELLDAIEHDIGVARGVLTGKYKYCRKCCDYYLTKAFQRDVETKETNICVYQDPINSGGNEYVRGFVDITYSICPKGHRFKITEKERRA